MFVVRPLHRESDVRSLLGFMSVASRWGNELFPGITVLTRDLFAVQAMHEVAVKMKAWEPANAHQFKKPDTDTAIARQLHKNLRAAGAERPLDELTQVMSYWLRYGSLLEHFDLLNEKQPHRREWYRRLIFERRKDEIGKDSAVLRATRIRHFEWYDRFHERLHFVPSQVADLFRGAAGQWRRWWFSGQRPAGRVPTRVRLVRRLEFAFIVWQTLFEAATQTFDENGRAKLRSAKGKDPVRQFALMLANGVQHGPSPSKKLAELCLTLHDEVVAPSLASWRKQVENEFGSRSGKLLTFDEDRTVESLANYSGSQLLTELCELHNEYCIRQVKTHAISVLSFFPKLRIRRLPPPISAVLSRSRWGLFGYRMEAAIGLHSSA